MAPTCTQTLWNIDVDDMIATFPTMVISALGCTDPEGTTLTYVMVQSPGSHFSVATDVVTITSDLDYVTATAHTLMITVTDGGTPALSVVVTINVNVIDVNDGPPTFTGTFSKTLLENVAISTSVSDVVASDPDGNTPAGILVYVITLGDTKNQFAIDSGTGRITTIGNLDRETDSSYNLIIEAREQGGANTATTTLTVTVDDINDNAPSCTVMTFAETVSESQTAPYDIRTLTCTDLDTAAFGTLTYTLTSGDSTKFEMAGNIFRLSAVLDFDAGPTKYDVVISVSDGTNSIDVTGTVNVGNVNEFTPAFTGAPYTVSKSESLALGSTIITVVATDGDSSATADGQITFAFTTTYPEVTIDAVSGDVILASSLNREASATLTFSVTASDGTNTVSTTITLTVLDENDNAPVFASASYTYVLHPNRQTFQDFHKVY
ncbi:protocadherin-16-like [Gigantopelta aegis]|uniref:protocadherin-16-like n=1 Tax=Gigantopelta aegis TaxID=1735272 RepID=UPI001B88930E|nr:protocadherin-16-like [Gigantopelta aegis]